MVVQIALALLAGIFVGALFGIIQVPIPAPPNLAGVLGIAGILLGYKGVEWLNLQVDIVELITNVL
ncbi:MULTISPECIES: XapX domain-containing protein [unclassified Halorhabdus]|uniref:XapX domain-containing protein n=1 Tax=unclassified Halorhabdus TaxID=2621901 RepID=UPI0023DB44BE|nr:MULTISPECIES: XapX domain-containing protein [unclassified Halorhabdus]WEL17137.1 Xanthosine utilization system component, XapX domain [Halorhabdus sp. SVX81]WEL21023.1 Xanthosine utilization system component, XapX domain [Halorhabdus sp. BNX81]